MAQTISHRALEIVAERTHRALAQEVYGSSFDLHEAATLPPDARAAAITIADGVLPLNSDLEIITALLAHGYQASRFHRFIGGIGTYARNRRSTS